jgi:murein DD-endopeptidase MepM/ murein hydrolase activator NlpD
MKARRWTLLIVPDGTGSSRSFAFSERALRRLATAGSVLGLVALMGVGIGIAQLSPGNRSASSQNEALRAELEHLRTGLRALQDTIAVISDRDQKLRILAGLPEVDSAVRAAGIGGPGLPTLSDDPVYQRNRQLGRLTFATRTDLDGLIRRANVLSSSFAEITDSLERNVERLAATPSIMPTAGWLSSHFTRARKHPILHVSRPHEGIDVSAPMGAPVVSPAAGVVSRIYRSSGYGLVLEVSHGNGIETRYAHLSRTQVRQGQRVTRGQLIANVGNSGLSTGPHLHYEIHVGGRVVNPLTFVLPEAIPD